MPPVIRYDVGSYRKAKKTSQGFLQLDATIARVGVQVYQRPDGTVIRELRRPEEVFSADALDSFAMAPVTDDHPAEPVTPENVRKYQKGHLGELVRADGKLVRASMLVTDADLIAKVEGGKQQLSCGYACELDPTPGEWNGQRYDAVQRNIRGNHVAVVKVGRAGPEVRAHLDAADAVAVNQEEDREDAVEGKIMKRIVIDGIPYEVPEAAAAAVEKALGEAAKAVETAKAAEAKSAAKADDAAVKLADADKARKDAEDPAKFDKAVEDRVALRSQAAKHLDAKYDFKGKTDHQVRIDVVEKLSGKKLDAERAKSADYVVARFDAAVENAGATGARRVQDAASAAAQNTRQDADVSGARERARKADGDAWKASLNQGSK